MFADFRSYAFAVVAVVGMTFAALADPPKPPQPSTAAEQPSAQKEIEASAPPIDQTVNSDKYTSPCEKNQDKRDSDLCAQWKAADAATEAATWGFWQIWIGVGGLGLGMITMAAAVAAAIYARQAAIHTQTGATAAIASANAATIANDATEMRWVADNRPWLVFTEAPTAMLYSSDDGRMNVSVTAKVKNAGKIPAFDVAVIVDVRASKLFFETSAVIEKFASECAKPREWRWGNIIIFPNAGETVSGMTEDFPEVEDEHRYAIILVCIVYRAMGHSTAVFHTATGLWAPIGDLDPKTEVNEPHALIADTMSVAQIRGCNSIG